MFRAALQRSRLGVRSVSTRERKAKREGTCAKRTCPRAAGEALEDDTPVPVHEHAILYMPVHRACEDDALDVAPDSHELRCGLTV